MLNKRQIISPLYTLKYGFGEIIFCKNEKIEIVEKVDDLKTRTYSWWPGGNEMTYKQSLDASERIFYMRYFHGGVVKGGVKENSGVSRHHV